MTVIAELLRNRSIIVCCGSGGVGKTTTAAALAVQGARAGRRTVVVTVDPARRLADALGADAIGNEAHRIEGDWPGTLDAVMLDSKRTFDQLVTRHAADEAQRQRILANRFYANISNALSGTQEYMAAEKLFELHADPRFELVVVDTPPTRNALDFLDAPRRLTNFLDHRLYRLLTAPNRGALRAVNVAAQAFLRSTAKVVGAGVLDDAVAFFQAFDGMEEGFRTRADRVQALLHDSQTAYVLVASPRHDAIQEALFFASNLAAKHRGVDAVVMNRMHPGFPLPSQASTPPADAVHWVNAGQLDLLAQAEECRVGDLATALPHAPLVRVPMLDDDVHDLDALLRLGELLVEAGAQTSDR